MTARESLEKYLVESAVRAYNSQFSASFDPAEFEMDLIHDNTVSELAYEVSAPHIDPLLRLRVYYDVGDYGVLSRYEPRVDSSFAIGGLGDEILVASGTLPNFHIKNDGWNIKAFVAENQITRGILARDGVYLETEEGEVLLREEERIGVF